MRLDPELVREAERAKEQLAVASHQRVHQILGEAAEPTRRRRWRREPQRLSGPAGPCSFCGRPRDVCAKLLVGPGVLICDRCVMQATRLAGDPAVGGQAEGSMRLEAPGSQAKCSFCGLEARKVRHLVAGGLSVPAGQFGELARICDKCRDLCLEILAEPSPA